MDEIYRTVRKGTLPGRLGKESAENGAEFLDRLIDEYEEGSSGMGGIEFLRRCRDEARSFANNGYALAKCGVMVPVGFWGLGHGFGAPDLDISMLGIGNHRFFLFHSALGLVVLRHFYRKWHQGPGAGNGWPGRVGRKVSGVALGTYAVGVGLHLTVDLFQPKSIVFPFFGSLVNGTLVDDNIWLLGNSIWAFKIGHDIFALTMAEEIEGAKGYVRRTFGWDGKPVKVRGAGE